jgi:hypothetical protein
VFDSDFPLVINLLPVISNVAVLQLCGTCIFKPSQAKFMLTEFITCLTLPFLVTLQIIYHRDQRFLLSWPHREFLASLIIHRFMPISSTSASCLYTSPKPNCSKHYPGFPYCSTWQSQTTGASARDVKRWYW